VLEAEPWKGKRGRRDGGLFWVHLRGRMCGGDMERKLGGSLSRGRSVTTRRGSRGLAVEHGTRDQGGEDKEERGCASESKRVRRVLWRDYKARGVDRLGEEISTGRPPGGRWWFGPQSTLEWGRGEEDKDEGFLGFDHGQWG
jgi:hypothetical protein